MPADLPGAHAEIRERHRSSPSAAAAQEAGFRPCLRCRPEISPELAFWRGTSNTVSRALALIEAGGLDEDDVEGLANRLGVGARQLRRLFRQHVGASPVTVAQTRRVLLAKQLIHETSLPMTEVALAAGFNSVRRFNETFRELFGRPPATLRRSATRRSARPARCRSVWPIGRPMTGTRCCRFLATAPSPASSWSRRNSYKRSIAFGENSGVVTVTPADENRVDVTVRFPDMAALPQIIARVRRVFDLAADPDAIGAHLALDPMLAPLVAARPGLRVPGAWDGFELAVRAILGQQITVPAATKLLGKLVQPHGAPLPAAIRDGEGLSHLFPSPAAHRRRRSRAARHARGAGDGGDVARAGDRRRSRDLQPRRQSRSRPSPNCARCRASANGPRNTSPCANCASPMPSPPPTSACCARWQTPTAGVRRRPNCLSRAERWRPWRAYAALHLWAAGAPQHSFVRKNPMSAKPPETFSLDRLKTPIGPALLVTDADGALRAFDWEDHAARVTELLRLQYGAVVLRDARAPEAIRAALSGYFKGDLASLNTIKWRVAGTPFQRKVWTRCRRFRPARP